jgi:hypothetical protein
MEGEINSYSQLWTKSRDSSVGVETGYILDGRGSIPSKGKRFFSA